MTRKTVIGKHFFCIYVFFVQYECNMHVYESQIDKRPCSTTKLNKLYVQFVQKVHVLLVVMKSYGVYLSLLTVLETVPSHGFVCFKGIPALQKTY